MDNNQNNEQQNNGENSAVETVNTDKIRKKSRSSRHGMYTAATSALVIAIVLIINLALGQLSSGALQFDLSGNSLYSVSDQSKNYLSTLDKNVQIIILAQNGSIDKRISKFLDNYKKLSNHITVQTIDPVVNPNALTEYNATENTVVVKCPDTNKTKTISLVGFDGYTDGMILYDYQTYYSSGSLTPLKFDAEGELTSAVQNVTSSTNNKLYDLTGHGESDLAKNAASRISKANIATSTLDLLKNGGVPSDCKLILSNNPTSDLADDELSMLEAYMQKGGKVMIMLDNPDLKNFNKLLAEYGLKMQAGYIGDSQNYYKNYYNYYGYMCIYPVLSGNDSITSSLKSSALLINSRGMTQVTPGRSSSSVSSFMTTSQDGIDYLSESNSTPGQYIIGAAATEKVGGSSDSSSTSSGNSSTSSGSSSTSSGTSSDNSVNSESRLTVISAIYMIDDNITSSMTSLANLDIFMNAVSANFGASDSSMISISSKPISVTYNTMAHPLFWEILFIALIPLGLIIDGIVNWVKRRKH